MTINKFSLVSRIEELLPFSGTPPEATESLKSIAVKYMSDIAWIINKKDDILYVNPVIQNITGWTPAEIQRKPFNAWIHPEDRLKVLQAIAACGNHSPEDRHEWRFSGKHGKYVWLSSKICNVSMLDRTYPDVIVISSRNDTVRKSFEKDLLKSEERFRTIFENAPIGVVLSRAFSLILMNEKMTQMLAMKAPPSCSESPRRCSLLRLRETRFWKSVIKG